MAERDRKKEIKEAYEQAWGSFGSWQTQAEQDIRAVNKNAWTSQDLEKMVKQRRDPMTFQLIRRNINWISGYQREHLLSTKYDPVENADERTAGQLTSIGTWVFQHSNYYFTISDAFEFALKAGINLINTYKDGNGDTMFDRYAYNQFVLDPTFRSRTLKDCQYGILRKHINHTEAKMLLPSKESFIDAIKESDSAAAHQDEMFTNYQPPTLYGQKLLTYDEFTQRTTKNQKVVLIPLLNSETVWPGTDAELKQEINRLKYDLEIPAEYIKVITRSAKTVEVTAYLNGEEMWNEIDPFGIGDFSFTPVMAYFDPDAKDFNDKIQGVARLLVDSQRASDKRMMSMTARFDMAAGPGLDFEKGALVDDEDAFATAPGQPRQFEKDAIAQNRYRDRITHDIPPSEIQLHDIFDKNMPKMININEEMFGVPPKGKMQIAGMLAKLRVGTGLIGQRGLFHNLALSTKVIGGKALKLFQQYTPDKVRRIINEEPAPAFYTHDFGKYDAVAAEGMLTDTQNNQFYAELVGLKEMGARMNDPFPASWKTLIKYMPVHAKMKDELIKEMEAAEQKAQQEQAKQQQVQEMMQKLQIMGMQSQMLENRAQAEERRTQSTENTTGAALDRVNTMTKIQEMQQSMQLNPLMELAKLAIEFEKVQQQNVEAKAKS